MKKPNDLLTDQAFYNCSYSSLSPPLFFLPGFQSLPSLYSSSNKSTENTTIDTGLKFRENSHGRRRK
ncbi:hypothetical protein K7X08_024087 [Anisodus acutangulus]|uniref:Uncharacterized protein n=1 Tax=Anisodus acutangulus TaxID=402998 RepID=A0A9Q1MA53_9SOLA|nr:hypothetical protein K7X08_024087 [Anisodus acutangulus]